MAASRLLALVLACVAAASACSDQKPERFAVGEVGGTVRLLVCSDQLPVTASLWEMGSDRIVGNDDDQLIWSDDGPWEESSSEVSELISPVKWLAGMGVSYSASTFPATVLGTIPTAGSVVTLDGANVSVGEFDRGCKG
ncbi:MAG TPA: hypothetical protein VK969_01305 [Acidimicrobiia bacterium]|nr:hypothetical protein [Acidimicrobiia bacterium]